MSAKSTFSSKNFLPDLLHTRREEISIARGDTGDKVAILRACLEISFYMQERRRIRMPG